MKLEIGYTSSFDIRKEYYHFPCKEGFVVLYLSDLHFNGYCKNRGSEIAAKIEELNPDIVLLGGDYADTVQGLLYFDAFMSSISKRKNVFAIAGNHDYFLGIEKIKKILEKNNAHWIEKDTFIFKLNNTLIRIDGNKPSKKKESEFSILCLHKPIDIKNYFVHYNMVFAGHLHGGQFVFWKTKKGMYPGRLFYRWNLLKMKFSSCLYLISKGLGDTLPIRYNCRKDIICVYVASKN